MALPEVSHELRSPAPAAVDTASGQVRRYAISCSSFHLHTATLLITAARIATIKGPSLPPASLGFGVLRLLLVAALSAVPVIQAQGALVSLLPIFAAATLDRGSTSAMLKSAA